MANTGSFELWAELCGFNIEAFDAHMSSMEDCPLRRSLEIMRVQARDLAASGNQVAARALLAGIKDNLFWTGRESFLLPMAQRDDKRQRGTRTPRRPDVDRWIDAEIKANPKAKAPALWTNAPEWITDQIGFDRFAKRVTAARKRVASK